MNKLKIVWICHFSNAEIQAILHPGISAPEFAPWITQLARLFENDNRIELHIIAPHEHILRYKHFILRSINYHFINSHIILFGEKITQMFQFDYRTNFLHIKMIVRKIVNKIKPDLIHLHGAENAYYSSSIFQFRKKYPVLITVQGFISHATDKKEYYIKRRIDVEKKILSHFRHFGYRTQTMGQDIKKYNFRAVLHWHHYPFPEIKMHDDKKKYDLVFFARISKDKGIEDLLMALELVVRQKPVVSLCVIGAAGSEYVCFLKRLAEQLGISKNVDWAGYLPTQADVHKLAASARISVVPTYNDIISGTIIESMFLKLPVVAYDVGSIHEVNEREDCISLAPKGDINGLSAKIIALLQDPEGMKLRSERTYKRALEMFDNRQICSDLIKAYNLVIADFSKSPKPSRSAIPS
jgi:glycosyltransferase involved in cell wall biosynthesis